MSHSLEALNTTIGNAIQALGRGFDVTSDIRLLYCKGASSSRLVRVDEERVRDLLLPQGVSVPSVPCDIECFPAERSIEHVPVCSFHEMARHFNETSGISGYTPLGSFNNMFNFTGSWQIDATATKSLAMVGHFIPLYTVHLANIDLDLRDDIKRSISYSWDPVVLASFIESYGTHVVTSVTVGGRDVVYIKQHQSSNLLASEIEGYLNEVAEQRFQESKSQPIVGSLKNKDKDVTVIFRRRGGDDVEQSHTKWAKTVQLSPDVINMTFVPIVSLMDDVSGLKHLIRAIDLYLDFKPPLEDLRYFLDFQMGRVWAPEQNDLQRRSPVCPSLQFSLMGPKLLISPDQITVGRKPVTGLRLALEGDKQNRLEVHLQHLVSLPKILQPHWHPHVAIGAPKWQGPEEQDSRWFEPIRWKTFSHISTAPIEFADTSIDDLSGVHIVTGAQLGVWDFGSKNVLYLKLLFSNVPGCTVRRSVWDHAPPGASASSSSSGSDDGLGQFGKLGKLVDTSEVSKGPQDLPGHWLVTGAKLGVDKGKIVLRAKYSLLNY